jgi:DME family drug/metabolite transporter
LAIGSVVLAGLLFGTAGTAQALGPNGTTSLGVGTTRLLVGGIALLAAVAIRRGGGGLISMLRVWRSRAGLFAGASTAVYQVCFFASVQQTGVALGTLVTVGSAPIFAGLLSWVVLEHRPSSGWVVATAVCLVGLILLTDEGLGAGQPAGIALALVAGLAIATFNVPAKQLMNRGVPLLDLLAGTFLLGAALLLPFLLMQPLSWISTADGALLAIYLGVVTMALANALMAFGLQRLTPGPVTTLMLADPLTATILGVMVLGETLAPSAEIGLALVFVGLVLQGVSSARYRRRDVASLAGP